MAIAYGSETLAESLVRYIGISGFSWWIVNSGLRLQYLEGELDAPEAAHGEGCPGEFIRGRGLEHLDVDVDRQARQRVVRVHHNLKEGRDDF